jgi:hypothetical protein
VTGSEWFLKSRTYPAQIMDVDDAADAGTMVVELIGSRERYKLDIPAQVNLQRFQSSWQRYCPQEFEYVDIAFDPRNRPRLVGMSTHRLDADHGAYADVARAAADELGGVIFRRLRKGEYDLRSKGGAGYYFDSFGHATLEAGSTAIELDKERQESIGTARLWVRGGDGVELRYGDVKRLLPGTYEETPATTSVASATAPKEWSVVVGKATAAATLVFADEVAGDVRDSLGAPVLHSGSGQPLRYRRRLYAASGLTETLSVEVDVLGSVKVTQAATATAGANLGLFSLTVTTTAAAELAAGTTLDLTSTGQLRLNAGGTADSEMVRGTELSTYLTTKLSVLTAFGPSGPATLPLAPGVELSTLGRLR